MKTGFDCEDIAFAADLVASRLGEAQPFTRDFEAHILAVLNAHVACVAAGVHKLRAWRCVTRAFRAVPPLADSNDDRIRLELAKSSGSFEAFDQLMEEHCAAWARKARTWELCLVEAALVECSSRSRIAATWIVNMGARA